VRERERERESARAREREREREHINKRRRTCKSMTDIVTGMRFCWCAAREMTSMREYLERVVARRTAAWRRVMLWKLPVYMYVCVYMYIRIYAYIYTHISCGICQYKS